MVQSHVAGRRPRDKVRPREPTPCWVLVLVLTDATGRRPQDKVQPRESTPGR